MRTKGRLLIISILALALLAACAPTTQTVKAPISPALHRIQQKGELVVGTAGNMPPLNMTTREGKIIGLEADLAQSMAAAMGVGLRFETIPFSQLLPALEAGRVDMILSNMTITPERNMRVAFVGPYFVSGKAVLTKLDRLALAREASEIDTPEITLTALKASTSQSFVEELIPEAKLVLARDYDEAVDMVIQDKVDAMIADYPICVVSVFRYPDQGLVSFISLLSYEPIGVALPANDPHLVNWVENFLGRLEDSGALEEMRDHWFGDASWLKQLP